MNNQATSSDNFARFEAALIAASLEVSELSVEERARLAQNPRARAKTEICSN